MAAGKRNGVKKSFCRTARVSHVLRVFRPSLCKSRVRVFMPAHMFRVSVEILYIQVVY